MVSSTSYRRIRVSYELRDIVGEVLDVLVCSVGITLGEVELCSELVNIAGETDEERVCVCNTCY